MSRNRALLIGTASAALFACGSQAMALNPQRLPPHLAPSFNVHLSNAGGPDRFIAAQSRRDSSVLRCRSVQVGDPRKQPPMKVCP
jgi:hypothetical protein